MSPVYQKSTTFPEMLFHRQIGLVDRDGRNLNAWVLMRHMLTSKDGPDFQLVARNITTSARNGLLYDSQQYTYRALGSSKNKTLFQTCKLNTNQNIPSCITIPTEVKDIEFAKGPVHDLSIVHCYRSCLYCLTSTAVYVFNVNTGSLVDQAVFQNEKSCSEFNLDHERQMMYVKSNKPNESGQDVFKLFHILHYLPLKYFGKLEVRRSIFAKSIVDAEISQGLLLTMHQKDVIFVYDLFQTIKGEAVPLLRVQSFQHQFYIGGNPYCFITVLDYNKFQIHLLKDSQVIDKGLLETSYLGFDTQISFHPDESARLLVTSKCSLRLYEIRNADNKYSLVHLNTYSRNGHAPQIPANATPLTTKSGRTVQRRISNSQDFAPDADELTQIAWDYEDELDILGVLYAEYRQERLNLLYLDLIEGKTGKILRHVELCHSFKTGLNLWALGLRLDACNCLISFSARGRTELLVFRFVSSIDT